MTEITVEDIGRVLKKYKNERPLEKVDEEVVNFLYERGWMAKKADPKKEGSFLVKSLYED